MSKVVIVHVSDIHIKVDWATPDRVRKMAGDISAAVARNLIGVERCILVATGDLAYSGTMEQYVIVKTLLTELRDSIRQSSNGVCDIVVVPGNHDHSFTQDIMREQLLPKAASLQEDARAVEALTQSQKAFFDFATSIGVDWPRRNLLHVVTIPLSYHDVEILAVNSAWTSTLKERQGALTPPIAAMREHFSKQPARPRVVVVAMHHTMGWFEATQARALRDLLLDKAHLTLTGHEHEAFGVDSQRGGPEPSKSAFVEGGLLKGDPGEGSAFNLIISDLEVNQPPTFEVSQFSFAGDMYVAGNTFKLSANHPSEDRGPLPFSDGFETWLRDPGAQYVHPHKEDVTFDDLFVYPELRPKVPSGSDRANISSKQLCEVLQQKQRVLVMGQEKFGKTSLCKRLMRDLKNSDFLPLYLSADDISDVMRSESSAGRIAQRAVEAKARDEYGVEHCERFLQAPAATRVILFDDFGNLSLGPAARDELLEWIHGFTSNSIVMASELFQVEDIARLRGKAAILNYAPYEMLPFGHVLREELIKRWVTLGNELFADSVDLGRRVRASANAVKTALGRNFIPPLPQFVLTILQTLESSNKLELQSGALGYLYEALITASLQRFMKDPSDIDMAYQFLSELAYKLHGDQAFVMESADVQRLFIQYLDTYRVDYDYAKTVGQLTSAAILDQKAGRYSFKYQYIFNYFVARYLRDKIDNEAVRQEVAGMLQRLHHERSANIVIFLCYLTKATFLIDAMCANGAALFHDHTAVDIARDIPRVAELRQADRLLLSEDTAKNRLEHLAEQDRHDAALDDEEDEDELAGVQEFAAQINRAYKSIQIIGQLLRNFPGSLQGDVKERLASTAFSLGLRTLGQLVDLLAQHKEDIVEALVDYFIRQRKKDRSEAVVEAERFMYGVIEGASYFMIKHISDSVGLEKLRPTYKAVLEAHKSNASYQMIDIVIRLDHFNAFPEKEIEQFLAAHYKDQFSKSILRKNVYAHFYLVEEERTLRQRVCDRLDISLKQSHLLDSAKKIR